MWKLVIFLVFFSVGRWCKGVWSFLLSNSRKKKKNLFFSFQLCLKWALNRPCIQGRSENKRCDPAKCGVWLTVQTLRSWLLGKQWSPLAGVGGREGNRGRGEKHFGQFQQNTFIMQDYNYINTSFYILYIMVLLYCSILCSNTMV